MNERFFKQFAKVSFSEDQIRILQSATDYKLHVKKAENSLAVELYFPVPVRAEKLFDIEREMERKVIQKERSKER